MHWKRTLQIIEAHCEGESGRIVTAGVNDIPGETIAKKLNYMNSTDFGEELRKFLVLEPRGAPQSSVNLLLPPTHSEADAAFLVLQADQAHAMSGSNAICVVTALLETGMVEMNEPESIVTLDTAAGLVRATASCKEGRCERVSLDMVPAYVERLDERITTERWGEVIVDIAFGGVFYAIVDIEQLGLSITPASARDLVEAGMALKKVCNEKISVVHTSIPEISGIAYIMFRDRTHSDYVQTCTTLWPGRVDRSPCGTGSSANLSTQFARGEIDIGESSRSVSIIGSEFNIDLIGANESFGKKFVLPRVSGRAWIYGIHQVGLDPTDPFPQGFSLSDTWGPSV